MTQKLFNLSKWTRLQAGEQLDLPGERFRIIRLHVNVPGDTSLSYVDADGEISFLASVIGRDTVEFHHEGKLTIMTDRDDTFIYTGELDAVHHVSEAPESFTKIMEKRARNPELERVAAMMNANMMARLDAQRDEYEALLERRFAAREEQLAAAASAGPAGGEPAPDEDAERSVDETS